MRWEGVMQSSRDLWVSPRNPYPGENGDGEREVRILRFEGSEGDVGGGAFRWIRGVSARTLASTGSCKVGLGSATEKKHSLCH